jgi:hypothetical protein
MRGVWFIRPWEDQDDAPFRKKRKSFTTFIAFTQLETWFRRAWEGAPNGDSRDPPDAFYGECRFGRSLVCSAIRPPGHAEATS